MNRAVNRAGGCNKQPCRARQASDGDATPRKSNYPCVRLGRLSFGREASDARKRTSAEMANAALSNNLLLGLLGQLVILLQINKKWCVVSFLLSLFLCCVGLW